MTKKRVTPKKLKRTLKAIERREKEEEQKTKNEAVRVMNLESIVEEENDEQQWKCAKCKKKLLSGVYCDTCTEWIHFGCEGVKIKRKYGKNKEYKCKLCKMNVYNLI